MITIKDILEAYRNPFTGRS